MYLCFDLGGTNIKAGIIDAEGNIRVRHTTPTKAAAGIDGILQQFKEISESLMGEICLRREEIKGVGVGIPGFVQMEDGIVVRAVNLGWENIPIKEKLEQHLGYPVFVINDANAAALGEMWKGAGQNTRDLLCLTLGTGIGAGIIIDGKIHNGSKGLAGEIGHFQIEPHRGRKCNCGKVGCLETESSGSALAFYGEKAVKQGKNTVLAKVMKDQQKLTSKDIANAAAHGDQVAIQIIDRAAYYLGLALANIYLVIEPQRIVIGGGVAAAGEILVKPIIKWFNHFSLADVEGEKLILPAKLGNNAGIIGLGKLVDTQFS